MQTIDVIRESLIAKLMAIKDKDFLVKLNNLIISAEEEEEIVLDEDQLAMLEMSEDDAANNRLVDHHIVMEDLSARYKATKKS
jgi:hypothetical protein